MVIRLDENYNAMTSTALLGYVGETNARPVSVEGLTVDGADRYVMTIDYGDGVTYEVDITGGQWTPTADILRSAQTVSCQICAKKLSGNEYILVKKSRIFRLRIGAAIGDNAVPSPDVSMDALDRIDAIGKQARADMQTAVTAAETAVTAAETATTAAENAEKSATAAEKSADTAEQAAERAEAAKTATETAAQKAQSVADSLPEDYVTAVAKIAENTAEIANIKITDKELKRRVDALYDIGQGITHKFETDSSTAYAKTIPTGGKLMSVKNVGGRSIVFNQLFDYTQFVNSTTDGVTFTNNNDGTITIGGTHTSESKIYSVKMKSNPTAVKGHKYIIMQVYDDAQHIRASNAVAEAVSDGEMDLRFSVKPGATLPQTVAPQLFDLTAMFGIGNEPASVEEFEAMFPADYYPYNAGEIVSAETESVVVGDTAYPIPESIKTLPGYGRSAGTARNYVDYENKRYVQCVSSVDLGTLTWTAGESVSFKTHHLAGQKLTKSYSIAPNFICPKYSTKTQNESWGKTSITGISATSNVNGYIYVNDTSYTDATAFKQAMQGVILYYELANPIITDISDLIDDDFLRNIEVEAGGSVTFKGGNDDYKIPVPSEEEYIVKLSEVGGSV